jgi:hypothetical protein
LETLFQKSFQLISKIGKLPWKKKPEAILELVRSAYQSREPLKCFPGVPKKLKNFENVLKNFKKIPFPNTFLLN